jgi:phosphatidate cytidylyltransferase
LNKFSDLFVRLTTALVGATVMIFSIVYSQWSFFAVFFIILLFCLFEFVRVVVIPWKQAIWLYAMGVVIYSLLFLVISGHIETKYLYGLIPLASIGLFIQLYLNDETPLKSMALVYLGVGYIILPISLLTAIGFQSIYYEPFYIIGLIGITWCMDTGAYFFGSAFGKNQLFKRVSPKKSWEGAVGGVAMAMFGAWLLSIYLDMLTPAQWLVAGAIVSITGICGDLVESYIKRIGHTKDSGASIPGHGGFLDRFDSLIFSIPFYLFFLKLL